MRSDAVFIKKDRDVLQVNLLGLDPAPGGDVWKVSESLVMARTFSFNSLVEYQEASGQKLPGLILSENLAYKLKIKLGETVSLLNPQISSDQALGELMLLSHLSWQGSFVNLPQSSTKTSF